MLQTGVKGWIRRAFGTPHLDEAVQNFNDASKELIACLGKLGDFDHDVAMAETSAERDSRKFSPGNGYAEPGNGVGRTARGDKKEGAA